MLSVTEPFRLNLVDAPEWEIIDRFEARVDLMACEVADATLAEVAAYSPVHDQALREEIRALARLQLAVFLESLRAGTGPSPDILAANRERAIRRARQLVPLAALLHSYLIAHRVITAEIGLAAGGDAVSRGAALRLTARIFDYNIALMTEVTEAYIETVQGDLAEVDAARRSLVDALLRIPDGGALHAAELARRAMGLGFDPHRVHAAVLAVVDDRLRNGSDSILRHWVIPALARAARRPEREVFAVARDDELVAVLNPSGIRSALGRTAADLASAHGAGLRAGIGPAFCGVTGFADSYYQARLALRHASDGRPIVVAPDEIGLFDELTVSHQADAAELIPAATRAALADPALRAALDAFVAANLKVADAANHLSLHPNSLRYRLRRIAERTGHDPHRFGDLLELVSAARVLDARPG